MQFYINFKLVFNRYKIIKFRGKKCLILIPNVGNFWYKANIEN